MHVVLSNEQINEAIRAGTDERRAELPDDVRLDDFVAYMPMHTFIFLPTREPWPAKSVNERIPPVGKITASKWLDQNRPVEQMTWCPGLPMLIRDKLVADGGWIDRPGCTILNLYRPPILKLGKAALAAPWLKHLDHIYPNMPVTSWIGWRIGSSDRVRKSTTPCSSAAVRESAKTPY